ncbi:PREDICTED: U11/U12 small nuclear ribonucleoprotein 25 kDa protein-like [Priapulus caudatus]|uniref:U11/U12 small nuclear ribonucleoprotein 25 kDa protein-like n=1 Tax=Priapulus caudatus TaxID=37621 RepID=A0ABM1EIF2_PRICU|nr:PREDICTED: U11/U12 small nuclear ribonucleoprotein 25 kDa protein-like [Priapulus caudatus]
MATLEEQRKDDFIDEQMKDPNDEQMKDPNDEQPQQESSAECTDQTLSHQDAMANVKEGLEALLSDPLMCDLPTDVTLDEVNSQIALEYGRSMTVNVRRADDKVYPVVVTQAATVRDLKGAITRYVALKLSRDVSRPLKHISWRYVWRTYWLTFEGQKLNDDKKPLKEYGIRNRDELTFIKRLRQR